jgi:hypothetical protein
MFFRPYYEIKKNWNVLKIKLPTYWHFSKDDYDRIPSLLLEYIFFDKKYKRTTSDDGNFGK